MTQLPSATRFTSDAATGAIYEHGAHVVDWTPAGHAPVLWMSKASNFDSTSPIRGGVPICLPWFGAGRKGDAKPAHGFARLRAWSRQPRSADNSLRYLLDLGPSDEFPHALQAEYLVSFSEELTLELSVTNRSEESFSFEEALHTYLAVSDIRSVTVTGLDGCEYLDKALGATDGAHTQLGDINFIAETDRVYRSSADVTIVDPLLKRRITVSKTNSANTVVWNPWSTKAAAMADFGNDEWPGMLCIEGANVLADAINLQPGATHSMSYRLRVEALD
jgi:glucose-6-phosphate 1-epimerase